MYDDHTKQDTLSALDNAKFGWFHVKACLVSGIGFYTDAYDLFIISIATQIIGYVYYPETNKVPTTLDTMLKMSALVGTLIGQLLFGYLADVIGRKKMYGAELMIIVITTFNQCFAANTEKGMNVIEMLILWRFFLEIGIGGDYPLSAIITSEFANTKNRGAMIAAVFAMQGFGILTGSITALAILGAFKNLIAEDVLYLDYVWRIVIGLGAIPAFVAIYYRLTIPETPRFTMDVKGDVDKAKHDVDGIFKVKNELGDSLIRDDSKKSKPISQFGNYLKQWSNSKVLLGTAVTWFALDVAFYGTNLNQPIILKAIGFSDQKDPYESLRNAALGSLIIALLGSVPGYWITVFTVDTLGRKFIQIMGFVALTVLFLILGALYHQILDVSQELFVAIYTLANLFNNFGPNATTFIIPGEVFPTRYRSTCHGISAAAGKLGAIISQVGFLNLKGDNNEYIPELLLVFSGFMFIGLLFTFLIPETKGRSLEAIAQDYSDNSTDVTCNLTHNKVDISKY